MTTVNWAAISRALGVGSACGSEVAAQAIEQIIRRTGIEDAVECFIEAREGYSAAQSVLQFIHSPIAMEYCYSIVRSSAADERRKLAAILLRDIADDRVLPWIADMKEDRSEDVQFWGFLTHEVLYDRGHLDLTQLEGHIKEGLDHRSPGVRQAARQINSRFCAVLDQPDAI
ncbi:MAG: hypothetical protein JNN20_07030 [Betaproteobacteria bacterium]|nr:hypothetical protein [Betaproteobacteria bacterium]